MMKIKPLLIAMMAICLTMGFTSCSNDEPVDEPVDGEVFTYNVNSVQFNMVYVKGGTFWMGATDEQAGDNQSNETPVNRVHLSSYFIGQTEVTQALWLEVMGANPSRFLGNLQRPVEQVSWNDCQTFLARLNELTGKNFRLLTEAEWEFAARGGNKSLGYKYAGSDTIWNVAWYSDNAYPQPYPVATKAPNELGLYDMSGNVCEWCQDWFDSYTSEEKTNPTVLLPPLTACSVVAAGTPLPRAAAYRGGTATRRCSLTPTWGCALPFNLA